MDLKEDYIHFNLEHKELINALKDNKTLTYDYIEPVFSVLDYLISKNLKIKGENDDEVEDVFQIGFNYLYSSIEDLERFVSDHFDDEIDEFIEYDQNIYFFLRLNDLDTALDGDDQIISGLLEQIESMFEYHKKIDKKAEELIEKEIERVQKNLEDVVTPDLFMDFADTLGIDLI